MEVVQYKCPNCGANLEFKADTQDFGCDYCGSTFTKEQIEQIYPKQEEHPLDKEEPARTEDDIKREEEFETGNSLYNCPNCGASIITDSNTSATACFYCHTPVILTGRLSGQYRPSKIIPFKTTKENAIENFKKWCGKSRFIPKEFKSDATMEKIQGIYIPFWLADCRVNGQIIATCQQSTSVRSGDYITTNVREYAVVREGSMIYEGIPADGSSKADDELMESIEPYDYSELKDFSMSYLSGHLAEKFDVSKEQIFPRVRKRAADDAYSRLKDSITGYSNITVTTSNVDVPNVNWKYMLLPVWFVSYKFKGKMYYYAMNGQTGKYGGNLPFNSLKAKLVAGGIGAALFTILSIIGVLSI